MKSIKNALVLGALALVTLGSSAFAEDAYVTFPNTVRCQACGAEYHVVARVMKNNEVQLKLQQINKSVNPKVH